MSAVSNGNPSIVSPRGEHKGTLIFLHGLGDQGHGWADAFKTEAKHDNIKFICPHSSERPVTLNMGMRMPAWFDLFGLDPNAQEDEQGINRATQYVHQLIDAEVAAGIPASRIAVGGFSMGGALAIYAGLTYPQKLGGIVGLSSFFLQRTKFPGSFTANNATPIFLGHGTDDFLVPLQFGQMSEQYIKKFNPKVELHTYRGMQHSSCGEMSSAKKKPSLVTCPQCNAVVLTKDSLRHQDFCGKPVVESEIACAQNGTLRGFNVAVDKAEGFLPPDAVGWEKEHSILINQQTMESLGLLARQPVRIIHSSDSFIGIVWPCKEVALLKVSIISSRIARERMITLESCGRVEKLKSLSVTVKTSLTLNPALSGFLEAYLSHSYLQYNSSVDLKYLGQNVTVTPEEPIESKMSAMGIDDDKKRNSKVVSTAVGYKIQILNASAEGSTSDVLQTLPTDLSNIGGCFTAKQVLEDYVISPVRQKESPCSVLIWGLPGSGKTLLLKEVALVLSGSTTYIGSCEELMELNGVTTGNIVIVDVNELEKENTKANRALSFLLGDEKKCVILCVRSSETLDIGFRVRFPIEAEITVPTQDERLDILSKIGNIYNFPLELHLDVARHTHGFTGGDLCSLLKAAKFARGRTHLERVNDARKRIRPTGIRQFILEVPNVSWNDIGGNEELKLEIQQAVIWPQKHPEAFERFGIDPPAGILLYGPPGCSKTLIARALASEAKMNFLAVKGPELFSKWVGDSEKAIRDLFSRARQVAPTIVFFDEIDAVGSSRGSEKSSGVSDRVLAQLLTELDGLEKSSRVILLAATNRPDQLDSALLRPGRLDRAIYVGLPCEVTRRAILEMRTKKMKFDDTVRTIDKLVEKTSGYSGAELVAVCRTAAMFAMRESIDATIVQWTHFEQALAAVVSRTEAYLLEIYDDFKAGRASNA